MHQKRGIEIDPIPAHPPMEMRSGDPTSFADLSNKLAFYHFLARLNRYRAQMNIDAAKTQSVIQDDALTIKEHSRMGKHDPSVGHRRYG